MGSNRLRKNSKVRRERRRREAAERAGAGAGRSPAQRLAELDQRLGQGQGAAKERRLLQALLAGPRKAPEASGRGK